MHVESDFKCADLNLILQIDTRCTRFSSDFQCANLVSLNCPEAAYSDVFSTQDGVWAWSAVIGALARMIFKGNGIQVEF